MLIYNAFFRENNGKKWRKRLDFGSERAHNTYMMNEQGNEMKVGDIVKSLDFVGIDSCYYVGKVISISKMDGTFRAEFIKRVWEGKTDNKFKTSLS